jgi:hypothetical protein
VASQRPLLFTISYLGRTPRIALEELDSRTPRVQKIVRLISSSRYGIHDLSRLKAREAGEYDQLNMPFELGIDVGCRLFGRGQHGRKRCLVLEAERFRYQAAISDLSNSDIAVHGGIPEAVVTEVRNWLDNQARLHAPGPAKIWGAFLEFTAENYVSLKRPGFSDRNIERPPIHEWMTCVGKWVARRRSEPSSGRAAGHGR